MYLSSKFFILCTKNATNISGVLNLANAVIPEKTRKRIVLISDGIETMGDGFAQSRLLQAQGITIDVFPLQTEEQPEVQLSALQVSNLINKNTEYDITLQNK